MNDNATDALLDELKKLTGDIKNEMNTDMDDLSGESLIITVSSVSATPPAPIIPSFKLDNTNLSEYVLEKSQELIESSLDMVDSLKRTAALTLDSKTMLAYAEILKATTGALDTLNSINLEKRKADTTKEIKQMDIDARKQLSKEKAPNNTLNLIATREEIIKMLSDKSVEKVLDAEFVELPKNT